jgi:ketopantoate hydroxymethyltransferase
MSNENLAKIRRRIFNKLDLLQASVNNSYRSACAMQKHADALKLEGQKEILDKVWNLLKDALPKEQ